MWPAIHSSSAVTTTTATAIEDSDIPLDLLQSANCRSSNNNNSSNSGDDGKQQTPTLYWTLPSSSSATNLTATNAGEPEKLSPWLWWHWLLYTVTPAKCQSIDDGDTRTLPPTAATATSTRLPMRRWSETELDRWSPVDTASIASTETGSSASLCSIPSSTAELDLAATLGSSGGWWWWHERAVQRARASVHACRIDHLARPVCPPSTVSRRASTTAATTAIADSNRTDSLAVLRLRAALLRR